MDKPARVEVGQRWCFDVMPGRTVEGFRFDKGLGADVVRWGGGNETLLDSVLTHPLWTFLGTPQDTEPTKGGVGVVAGQRRRFTTAFSPTSPFDVLSREGDQCEIHYLDDPEDRQWSMRVAHIEKNTTLLDAAPLDVPATNIVVDPSLQPKDRPGLAVRTPRSIQREMCGAETKHNGYTFHCQMIGAHASHVAGSAVEDGHKTHEWPRAPKLREVSNDGKSWVPYSSNSGYSFDTYKWRREDGMIIVAAAVTSVRVVGKYFGDAEHDRFAVDDMRRIDAARRVDVDSTPEQPKQSNTRDFVGVWSLRSGR